MHAFSRLATTFVLVSAASAPALASPPKRKPVAAAAHGGSAGVQGPGGAFLLDKLPVGKDVTIPRPATTLVPLSSRVMLTATDLPQAVSFQAVNPSGGAARKVRIGIYDASAERVKYIDIDPGTKFLYDMKDFETITIVPYGQAQEARTLALMVESNKPLQIAH